MLENKHAFSLLFADDLASSISYKSPDDARREMQLHLDHLEKWSNRWRLQFAPHKCNIIVFSEKSHPDQFSLKLYNELLPQVKSCKFLGIIFDQKLSFKEHFEKITESCEELLKILKVLSHSSWTLNFKTLLSIFKLLIRSLIEYSSIIYDITAKSITKKLQIVQNDALRLILKLKRENGNQELHTRSKIEYIEDRMKNLNKKYLNKAMGNENELIESLVTEYEEFYLWNRVKKDTILCH